MNKNQNYMAIFFGVSLLAIASLFVVSRPSAQVSGVYYPASNTVLTAPRCGSAQEQILSTKPTGDSACSSGSAIEYITSEGSPHWYWKCSNASGTVSCYAIKTILPVCGTANGQTFSLEPLNNTLCVTGSASSVEKNSSGWSWSCRGNSDAIISCHANISIPSESMVISESTLLCGTANGQSFSAQPADNLLCAKGSASGVEKNTSSWNWKCMEANSSSFQYCRASLITASNQPVNNSTLTTATTTSIQEGSTVNRDDGSDSNDSNKDEDEKIIVENDIATAEIKNTLMPKDTIVENSKLVSLDSSGVERSVVLVDPIKVLGKSLSAQDNPKKYGSINETLKIERVQLESENDGKNNIVLAGKAEPNAFVTIFIFSSDPIVITIKADANGNWNYELNHELEDGQHETYIAIRDEEGKILSKSEPIAFVKTAQAVDMIPVSQLTGNESPVERSFQQYILIAIIIMSACLVVALVLMGFLSHKQNTNEGIN
ncbi:MAG: hypothetical protein ACD_8C00076G0004 [uncultured bacterium]|nr:MAG: hypothetical protein ACD_8C00076G0004 [uncultured bacterium]